MRLVLILALAAILLASPSSAQSPCTLGDIGPALFQKYGEYLIFQGVATGGLLFEFYASPDRGTWTIVRQANGVSCMIAFGERWEPGTRNPESEPEEKT